MAAVGEWWEAAKAAVAAYTGLSSSAFFTAVAVAAALYVTVSGLFARSVPPPRRREEDERAFEPLPPPVQLGEVTEEELRVYDGSDPRKPLLMAIKGQIYDITQSRMFYGPGGPYALFAGRDASRALAKMSFEPSDLTCDVSGLEQCEVEALQEWECKFMSKYVKVGTIKKTIPVSKGDVVVLAGISERNFDASTVESIHVLVPEENGCTSHGSAVENLNELPDSEAKNTISHEDAVDETEETPGTGLRNASNTDNPGEPKGTPDVDEKITISPEDAVEKPKEAPDADVKSCRGHEPTGEPMEAPDVDENNTSGPQDAAEEKPKKISDVEVKNA